VLLTGLNPDVLYELAVAQSAARPVILLIEKGVTLPFDVKDLRCIQYEMVPISRLVKGVFADRVEEMLRQIKRQGWTAPNLFEQFGAARKLDDERQIRHLLEGVSPDLLSFGKDKRYGLPGDPAREICLFTGDITDIKNASFGTDAIVSLENTDLQLACYYEANSISAALRYLDAERSADGRIARDCLDQSLQKRIDELHIVLPMVPGRVIATPTSRLNRKYGIKYVFHAAALQGEIGDGYRMMDDVIDDCVGHIFDSFAEIAPEAGVSSVLFPMLGAATTDMTPLEVARKLLSQIVRKMTTVTQCRKAIILARLESHRQGVYLAAAELGLKELSQEARV
jgi:O-acetyl-ADP-ribose deacetylase (regulator of RNase III)